MTYLNAVQHTSTLLQSGTASDTDMKIGLELVQLAWQHLASNTDPVWDLVGLEVLALTDPTERPTTVAAVDGPHTDNPHLRAAVSTLLTLLARWHDKAATVDGALPLRLRHSAAAVGLRRAAEILS